MKNKDNYWFLKKFLRIAPKTEQRNGFEGLFSNDIDTEQEENISKLNLSIYFLCEQHNYFRLTHEKLIKNNVNRDNAYLFVEKIKISSVFINRIDIKGIMWLSGFGYEHQYDQIVDHCIFFDKYLESLKTYADVKNELSRKKVMYELKNKKVSLEGFADFIGPELSEKINKIFENIRIQNILGQEETKRLANLLFLIGKSLYPKAVFLKFF